jgi:hypothetical protein
MATRAHPVNDRIDKTLSKRPPEPTPVPEIERPAVNLAKILQRTTLAPNSLRPAELLHLQRTLGNRAVGAILARPAASSPLIQAKLTVNAPGDEYEREADRVALRREEQVRTSPCEPLSPTVQRQHGRENENTTNIPDHLKAGIETLSGLSLDDVKVHYNSSKPARLEALAYTQGTDIHVGPGQEKHLAHEAWHVVQQKQGRVRPTLQMKDGIAINDDAGLEREADELGTKALQMGRPHHITTDSAAQTATAMQRAGETRDASAVAGAAIGSPEEKVRLNFLSTPDRSRLRSAAPATAPVRQMRFSLGERGQLAQLPQVANSGNVQGSIDVLRDHTTRLANDLIALAGFNDRANQRPTLQEMVQIDRFTNAHLGQLGNIQQINTWADIAQLAAGTRSVADLVTLAALQVGGATPTLQEMVGVNRFTIN